MDPHRNRKLYGLYDATASTKAKSPECRDRYVGCSNALIARCGEHATFALTRKSLAEISGYPESQTRYTLKHFEATRLIVRIPGQARSPGSLLSDPLRYRWSDWAIANLGVGGFPGRISSESVSDRSKSNPQSNLDSAKSNPESDQGVYNSHFPLRCHSEGSESSLVGKTDQSLVGFEIQPRNPTKAKAKGAFPPAPPGFAETRSLTLLPRPEGARGDYEAVLIHLNRADQQRWEREHADEICDPELIQAIDPDRHAANMAFMRQILAKAGRPMIEFGEDPASYRERDQTLAQQRRAAEKAAMKRQKDRETKKTGAYSPAAQEARDRWALKKEEAAQEASFQDQLRARARQSEAQAAMVARALQDYADAKAAGEDPSEARERCLEGVERLIHCGGIPPMRKQPPPPEPPFPVGREEAYPETWEANVA
ncbi:cell envelope integrity protein TolA [Methylobacterium phyllosphaerae]